MQTRKTHVVHVCTAVFVTILFICPSSSVLSQTCTQPITLRAGTCPVGATTCTSKGSTLTWSELDADLINIANLCNSGGGTGTVTSVATGVGLTGGTITTTGTISLDLTGTLASNSLTANQCTFGSNGILCEGSVADAFETYLTLANPTADRTITLPNVSGTVITTGDVGTITDSMLVNNYSGVGVCSANTWASTLSDNAAPTCTQPGFGNLSGNPTLAQLTNVCSGAGNQVVQWANTGVPSCITTPGAGGGSGTVTSVAATVPGVLFSLAGSPITTSGTLAFSLLTQTANTVLAGPTSGVPATPTFRSLVTTDIPTLNQNTTGTAADLSATLSVAHGGTNLTSAADDNVMVGNATTWQSKALPNCTDTTGNHLNYTTATNTFSCGTTSSGGGSVVGLTSVETAATQRVFMSSLQQSASGLALTSGTAYFVYVGLTSAAITPKFVEWYMNVSGAGAQTAEVGLFSTPNPPNKSAQTFTLLTSTGTVDTMTTTTAVKRNTVAFSTSIPAATHLWAGIRTAMATTQPSLWGLSMDMGEGFCQNTAAAAALTTAGPWTGALSSTITTSWVCPILRVTLD